MTLFERIRNGEMQHSSHLGDYENDPVALLCAETVIRAIIDWRTLVKSRAWLKEYPSKSCNFDELRIFFKSGWCDFLMQKFEITPERILDVLEEELEEAQKKGDRK